MRIRNEGVPVVTDATGDIMARRRVALASLGRSSTEYRQLNRAARSAIRRDSCDDVRRRIREEGRNAMWRVIRLSVGSKGDSRIVPYASPDQMNHFFVGVGPRVAGEVRDIGEAPHLPCRLPRVGACALTLAELRTTVFGMSRSAACAEDGVGMVRTS